MLITVTFGVLLSASAQSGQTKRIYLFDVNNNGYGYYSVSLLHGSYGGNTVYIDTAGNGYVNTDAGGNFSVTGLYADRCASAPTSTTYLLAVSQPTPAATISETYAVSFGSFSGSLTFTGTQDPYMSTAYDITSVTGTLNGNPVHLVPVPSGANSATYVFDPWSGIPVDNVLYPNGDPATGGMFDTDGILFTDGTYEFDFFAGGTVAVVRAMSIYGGLPAATVSFTPTARTGGIADPTSSQLSLLPLPCSQLPTVSTVSINDLTTVAGVYAMAGLADPASASEIRFSTNYYGDNEAASNAAIIANQLVDSLTGSVHTTLPNGDPIPVAKINSLASILAACRNSSTGAECTSLFAAATPAGRNPPKTTAQAVIDIALNTSHNVSQIYAVQPASTSYQPALAISPIDWTLPSKLPSTTTFTINSTNFQAGQDVGMVMLVSQPGGTASNGNWSCSVNGAQQPQVYFWSGAYAPFSTASFPVGIDAVTCSFTGGTTRYGSTSAPTMVNVTSPPAAMTLACAPTSIIAGRTASCTAQLPAGSPGSVSFTADGETWTSTPIAANGTATASDGLGIATSLGQHTVTANYIGDATHPPAMAQATVTVSANTGGPVPVYSYNITQPDGTTSGYAPNGNIMAYTDSVNGRWAFAYDSLNRLVGSSQIPVTGSTQYGCWSYDSFGNMHQQYTSNVAFSSAAGQVCQDRTGAVTAKTDMQFADASNRITSGGWRDSTQNFNSGTPAYDAAGNMTNDLHNTYLYDPDGHVCAMQPPQGGITGYLYDAEGHRVAKGTLTSFSCDPSANGFVATSYYIIGPDGQEMTEVDGSGIWVHTNVSAGGQMIATYENDGKGVHFQLADWLGTRRVQTTYAGQPEDLCQSQPFGDGQNCSHPELDASDHHFTGKERDAESGLDYFGARYYASNMGRWMSPDWSAKVEAVPHAVLTNPQSLNLYQYGFNNPLSNVDPDGHDPQIEYLRRKAVRLAWDDERAKVARTGTGTRPWTPAERAELLQTGRVSGYQGHHINSVNGHPELAGEPNNVEFVEGVAGNLAKHGGNFQNVTTGEMLNRSLIGLQALDILVNAVGAGMQSNITGTSENIVGSPLITDPAKAAITLDGATITTYGFWTGKDDGTYSVQGGQYIDSKTNKPADPKKLKGRLFYINDVV